MRLEDTKDLAKFIDELQKETDRGLPLVGTALIDEKLRDTLNAFFISNKSSKKLLDEPNSPLGTFSARLDACFALGLINEYEYSEITLLRKVRNEFAHAKHGFTFSAEKIIGLCSSLTSHLPIDESHDTTDSRFRFVNAVVSIILQLYYRPEWVTKEKRTVKEYGDYRSQWISVKNQLPPDGMPIIAVVKKKP